MERSKQTKHVVCNKDNDADNGVEDCDDDDGVDDGVKDSGDDGDDGADKHFTHLLQAADCCLTDRIMGNRHVVCNKDDGDED
eukprot:3785890-Ditylum_brightwellii.AAC.1